MAELEVFLKSLPTVATSPLAFAAYALALGAWILRAWQLQKPQNESRKIIDRFANDHERNRALSALLGTQPPEGLKKADILKWVKVQAKGQTHAYLLIAYVCTVVAILIVVVATIAHKPIQSPSLSQHIEIRLHAGVGADCPSLPPETLITVTTSEQKQEIPVVNGCEAQLEMPPGPSTALVAHLTLSGAADFELSHPDHSYWVSNKTWDVQLIDRRSGPRMSIVMFDYNGIESADARDKFDQFYGIVREKLHTLAEQMSAPGREYLGRLDLVRVHKPLELNPDDTLDYWKASGSLEILSGVLFRSTNGDFVRSRPYFGELATEPQVNSIQIELRLDPDEFGTTIDTHSVAVLYALAMDAQRLNYPRDTVLAYLGRALSICHDLDSATAGAQPVKQAVLSAYARLNMSPPAL